MKNRSDISSSIGVDSEKPKSSSLIKLKPVIQQQTKDMSQYMDQEEKLEEYDEDTKLSFDTTRHSDIPNEDDEIFRIAKQVIDKPFPTINALRDLFTIPTPSSFRLQY